ncbi:MAG: type A2 lantipeptide [Rhizonema sp. PD37]|nr:type A2 lantipeptide [Rhizonema sp. PD37]
MSKPNENQSTKQVNEYIEINENGEVVVKDSKLAESLQELSPEELEHIAGGVSSRANIISTNSCC